MIKSQRQRLEEILLESQIITQEQLGEALKIQEKKGGHLSQILIEQGFVSEEGLLAALSRQFDLPPVDLSKVQPDHELLKLIPQKVAEHYQIIPISRIGRTITLATSEPMNLVTQDHIRIMTGHKLNLVLTTSRNMHDALHRFYRNDNGVEELVKESSEINLEVQEDLPDEANATHMLSEAEEAPVIKLVNHLISQAISDRASDIHLEPYDKEMRVRYRIDGVLQEKLSLPKRMQAAVISRLKVMSDLDIAERRMPQDGRFRIRMGEREVDFRINSLPTAHGEKLTLRILDKSNLKVGLEKIGLSQENISKFSKAILKPYGMLLVTGPTGSGKTTTLYSAISTVNSPDRQILTIEDPIEYRTQGINQIQVRQEIGLTFAEGLRAILRADPDIVMVGEIRDKETADIAIKAALTGHLTLSSIHTNDAPSTIIRLVDMGIEPFLISSSLIIVIAQRLARKVCERCREPYRVPESFLTEFGLSSLAGKERTFYHGKGCEGCNNTGFRGRIGLFEVLLIDGEIRKMILKSSSLEEIREEARKSGMKTLREDGIEKTLTGETSLEEVLRVTKEV